MIAATTPRPPSRPSGDGADREARLAEVLGQRIAGKQVGVVADHLDGPVELCGIRQRAWRADVGDGQLAQFLLVPGERPVELVETAHAQFDVGRPGGGVEGAAGGGHGGLGLGDVGVRCVADDLARGGVERGERALGLHEGAIDE